MSDGALLVIARAGDPIVPVLRACAPGRIAHATIADLSRAGWRYEVGNPSRLSACASGRVLRGADVVATLCRIGAITTSDLPHIHDEDRVYVAAEMNAFLHAWLMQFDGVRFNEPSWVSLAGPSWHPLQWTWLLERLGIPVAPSRRSSDVDPPNPTVVATLIGAQVCGTNEPELADYTQRIAYAARSQLLAVTFMHDGQWKFVSADPCPTLTTPMAGLLVRHAFASASASRSVSASKHGGVDAECGAA